MVAAAVSINPASIEKSPPATVPTPNTPSPTLNSIFPPLPFVAPPVSIMILPLVPELAVPDLNINCPLVPSTPAFRVRKTIAPLEVGTLALAVRLIAPPVCASPVAILATCVLWPDKRPILPASFSDPVPTDIKKLPAFPCAASPVEMTT